MSAAGVHPGIAALALEQMRASSYNGPDEWFVPVLFWVSREKYRAGNDAMCMTDAVSLDAPDLFPAGACVNLSPWWFPGDDEPQLVIKRGVE